MKKTFKKLAVIGTFAFILLGSMGFDVSAKVTVVKSYYYDDNIYTGAENFHKYVYIDIPDDGYLDSSSEYRTDSDWNYTRYQVINYYYSGSEGYF